ncbi:MAG: hypothetical protein JW934_13215 [Anaerolineae bacterium]|nr:hypothetical protein [Anaerolineae bacterium]
MLNLHTRSVTTIQDAGQPAAWTRAELEEVVTRLFDRSTGASMDGTHPTRIDGTERRRVIAGIIELGLQPEVLAALRQRRDPPEAVRDLATRYAFAALMIEGCAFADLDPLSQAMIRYTLGVIYKRAFQVAQHFGEDPLDEDPGLLLSLCKCLSRYLPARPMRAHIQWKLDHYESAVSRALRQIENLVTRPEIAPDFAAFVLSTALPNPFKAQLLHMARGGGRSGLNYEAVIRFFALDETTAWVKRYAGDVQTARTLYDEQEYADIPWRGKRHLPQDRRQGYLDAALASLDRREQESLDDDKWDMHDLVDPTAFIA